MPKDALGRSLEVGQVAVHFSVHGHRMESRPVIIKGFNKTGTVAVERLEWERGWDDEKKRIVTSHRFQKAAVKVPAYLCIVDWDKDQLHAYCMVEELTQYIRDQGLDVRISSPDFIKVYQIFLHTEIHGQIFGYNWAISSYQLAEQYPTLDHLLREADYRIECVKKAVLSPVFVGQQINPT